MISRIEGIRTKILADHNDIRALYGLPLLVLDMVLCDSAQAWAEKGIRDDLFKHDTGKPFGENIAWRNYPNGLFVGGDTDKLFGQWLAESLYFKYDKFPNVTKDFTRATDHYSQLIWKKTTKLGVGYAYNGKHSYLVCRYDPPGNIYGEYPY